MRITAGILMIISGIIGGSFWYEFVGALITLPAFLAVIGGYYTLKGQRWNLALAGASCSIIVPFFGIPAVILLVIRKSEFTSRGKATSNEGASTAKHHVKTMNKQCPHCGQSLHDAAFKCSRCKRWVPNELFKRLSKDDVELIKNNNLIPYTPSLLAVMVLGTFKDSDFGEQQQKELGRKLTGREQFSVLVFQSYCYFNAIHINVHMKRGLGSGELPCRYIIEKQLQIALLNGIVKSTHWTASGFDSEELSDVFKVEAEALFNELKDTCKDLRTNAPSKTKDGMALASAIYGDEQANIINGLSLYMHFLSTSINLSEVFTDIFLVEEKDFDWQSIIG